MASGFSIVIPAYNEEKRLPDTLESVFRATNAARRESEVIVVDNNSTDATAAIAKAYGAKVVFEPVNQIARARNAGGVMASHEFIIFIDADALMTDGLLAETLRRLDAGAAGGGSLVAFDQPLPCLCQFFLWLWNALAPIVGVAAGTYVFVRRDAFLATGGFSEKVFAGEEIHFSKALRKWAKANGRTFEIISSPRPVTSARKMNWYSQYRVMGAIFLFAIFPFLTRFKSCCGLWYKRPEAKT